MSDRDYFLVAAHVFLWNDAGEVLLAERTGTGYADGLYSVPAGHVESGETYIEAMQREALEEVGIVLAAEDIAFAHVMHRRVVSQETEVERRIDFFFSARRWSGELYNAEPEKCAHIRWTPIDKLPENMCPYVLSALQHVLADTTTSVFIEPAQP